MRTEEELKNDIETWDGVNKHITRQARKELREIVKPNITEKKPKKEEADFDLNNDGKVDEKDRSLAGKFLGSKKGKSKNK